MSSPFSSKASQIVTNCKEVNSSYLNGKRKVDCIKDSIYYREYYDKTVVDTDGHWPLVDVLGIEIYT